MTTHNRLVFRARWKTTPPGKTSIDYCRSIYQVTDADIPLSPKLSTDPGFYRAVMQLCTSAHNYNLGNQALRNPNDASDQIVYTTMAQLCARAPGDRFPESLAGQYHGLLRAVGNGIELHDSSIET